MELKQIASFAVDHTKLVEGMYTSRVDGDVTTYDIRMVKPNCGIYLPYPAIHSFEHLFATYVRSSELSDQVIYVGPMGCRTGFYFLVRNMEPEVAIKLVNDMLAFIASFGGRCARCHRKGVRQLPRARPRRRQSNRPQDDSHSEKLDARRLRLRKIANVRHAPVSKGTL